jgi:hypothetical protein
MKNCLLFLIHLLLVVVTFRITAQEASGNLIGVSQQLGNQSAYIEQIGTGLKTTLRQDNLSNTANIQSFGQNITQIVVQTGNDNKINSWIENSTANADEIRLYQQGMNNIINLSVKGAWQKEGWKALPIAITQEGYDFKVSVSMDPYAGPIEVHQYNGLAGGMEVQIRMERGFSVFPTKK